LQGALQYCEGLIENPHRTMVVLVSDLCEGGSVSGLLSVSRGIIESGAKLICLTALDSEANPVYDRNTAQKLSDMGAHVGAMTPEALGDFTGKTASCLMKSQSFSVFGKGKQSGKYLLAEGIHAAVKNVQKASLRFLQILLHRDENLP